MDFNLSGNVLLQALAATYTKGADMQRQQLKEESDRRKQMLLMVSHQREQAQKPSELSQHSENWA